MIINVKVKTRHSEQKIESLGEGRYLAYLKSEPEQNKANIELINLLSKFFGVPAGGINIKSGASSRNKIIRFD